MTLDTPLNQQLLEQIVESSITCIFNHDFSIHYASKCFCLLSGYSKKQLANLDLLQIMRNHQDNLNSSYHFLTGILKKNEIWKGEFPLTHKNNSKIYFDTTIKPFAIQNRQQFYIATFIDTHNRKQLIDSLKQRAHQQGLIAILGQLSLNNIPISDLLEQTLSVICGSLNIESGMILEISRDRSNASISTKYNIPALISDDLIIAITKGDLLNHTLQNKHPVICKSFKESFSYNIPDVFTSNHFKSAICCLIGDKTRPFGIVTLLSNNNLSLNIDEINFIQSICNILSEAINRNSMEKALRHEQKLSRKYLNVAEVIFIVIDINEKIILANHHAASVLGVSQTKLIGLNFFNTFVADTDRNNEKNNFHLLLKNRKDTTINSHTHDNTSPIINNKKDIRFVKWKTSVIYDDDSTVSSVLYSGEDITDLLAYEKEQKQLEKQLNQAQKMEAVGMLAGGIAHDFNNILASILGFSDLAIEAISSNKTGNNNEKLDEYLLQIKTSGIKARDIIAQMQSINLQDDTPDNAILLPSLLKGTLQMLRSALPSSINMKLNIRNNVPAVHINASRFNQIVMHLLTNARNALDGKGQIDIGLYQQDFINVRCSACNAVINEKYVVFYIHDNGPGFKNTSIPKLLNSTATKHSGLSLVNQLVHETAGHVLLSDHEKKSPGTHVQLLFKIPDLPLAEADESVHSNIEKLDVTNKHIMIVDDENSVATYMGELFRNAGFNVSVFCEAQQALDIFRKTPDRFDLIITDQTMPILTGDILATKMLQIKPLIPIIICSGHNDIFDKTTALDLNVCKFLKKPVDSAQLLHTVVNILS